MSEQEVSKKTSLVSGKVIAVAFVFGMIARVVVEAQLHITIPGTSVVTDPRELFTTIGTALTGPIGGVVIGFLAGIREPEGIQLASLLAHISGGLWMGFAYKRLVYEHLQMPMRLVAWAGLVLVYYYVFALPGFAIGLSLFYGETTPVRQIYTELAQGVVIEALLTTVITTLVMFALPKKYQRPLW